MYIMLSKKYSKQSVHTSAYQCIPVRTSAYQCIPVHTSAYQCIPVHTSAYQCIPVHTSAYQCIPVHTSAYQCIPRGLFHCLRSQKHLTLLSSFSFSVGQRGEYRNQHCLLWTLYKRLEDFISLFKQTNL